MDIAQILFIQIGFQLALVNRHFENRDIGSIKKMHNNRFQSTPHKVRRPLNRDVQLKEKNDEG